LFEGTVPGSAPRLGLRANWRQFAIFTVLTLLIGMTIGVERVAVPPLARAAFGITGLLYTVSFVSAFGAVKALMNLVAGRLSDRHGRRPWLLLGWAFAVPYALLIIFARAWWWVVAANLFLGVNQALTWTMSVTAKIDLVGPVNRGLAVGIDEAAGYVGTGLGGFAAGLLAASLGLRPAPYLLALGVIVAGAALTWLGARETLPFARAEARGERASREPGLGRLFAYMLWQDPTMLAACQAGLVNKVADSLVIAFFPLYFLSHGLTLAEVGLLVGEYALVWGLGQVGSGWLADRLGRKPPVVSGTLLLAVGVVAALLGGGGALSFGGAGAMGVGMALAYPNLLTAVGDTARPAWRGGALGVYRLCRDSGYAVGPLLLALAGIRAAFWLAAGLLTLSGVVSLALLQETLPRRRRKDPLWLRYPDLSG
jgi:MFS family permease